MSQSLIGTDIRLLEKKPPVADSPTYFEPVLDSRQAAALLGIHPKTLQRLARSGRIPSIRIGKSWAFRASALDNWLKANLAS